MQFLTLSMIFVVCTFSFLARGNKAMQSDGWIPTFASFTPEIISLIVSVFVIAMGTRNRFQFVRPAYWIVFGILIFCTISGILINSVEPGPVFVGLRQYLRAIPLFFLPAVFKFDDRQLQVQFKLLIAIALIQIPLSIHQRLLTVGRGDDTGDWTSGTLMISSIMSLFLIAVVCILTAMFIRKKLRLSSFVIASIIILIPTTINETKGTLLLLPIAVMSVFIVGSPAKARVKHLVVSIFFLFLFAPIFAVVYDYFLADDAATPSISEFFTETDKLEQHVYKGDDLNPEKMIGRVDAVLFPLKELATDPTKLFFGFGMGNTTESGFGIGFSGRYYDLYGVFTIHSIALILLELGISGIILIGLLYWFILRDSIVVAKSGEGTVRILALGWIGVTILIAIGSVYKNLIYFESISYLFWFYSGLIAAERMRVAKEKYTNRPIPRDNSATSLVRQL